MLPCGCPRASWPASLESNELRTPPQRNPALVASPQPPSQRRRQAILRRCLVAASIDGSRGDAVPLTVHNAVGDAKDAVRDATE
jgi:hypothetical protein